MIDAGEADPEEARAMDPPAWSGGPAGYSPL